MHKAWPNWLLSLIILAWGEPAWGQEESASAGADEPLRAPALLVREGNTLFADGALEEALSRYDLARQQKPDSPDLAYNRGLTHFKLGNLDQAGDILNQAVFSPDRDIEAASKFMLGNVQHLRAVDARQQDPQAAIDALQQATRYYLDALALQPDDDRLRGDVELAQNLIQLIREEQEQQQQEDRQQSDQQDQQSDEREEKQEQGEQENEQQENEQQDSEDQEQQPNEEQEGESEEAKEDEQGEQQEGKSQEEQEGQQQQAEQNPDQDQADDQQARQVSPEQVERMLQQIRDKERQRRLQKARQAKRRAGTVKKDW